MKKFKSDRTFKNWAYTVSHSILIIRSDAKIDDEIGDILPNDYTLDIEFRDVMYLKIPSNFDGLSICIKQDESFRLNNYITTDYHKIYEIKSNDSLYYIVASCCIVGKSKWLTENTATNFSITYDEVIEDF